MCRMPIVRPSLSLRYFRQMSTMLFCFVLLIGLSAGMVQPARAEGRVDVTFSFAAPAGVETVTLAGTFNGWNRFAHPMQDPDGDGVFTIVISLKPARYEYKFVVDGQRWYHDPNATESAPDGFGGKNSVLVVKPTDGQMGDSPEVLVDFDTPDWAKRAVFYQIFPERFANGDPTNDPPGTLPWGGEPTFTNFFGGDLRGVIEKIPYLKELGITAIWFNPLFASVSNHKYGTSDYMRIDPHFGDEATFKEMVDKLHAAGIRVVLDGVFNHTGDKFWAFQDLIQNGARSPYVDWYFVHQFPIATSPLSYEAWWGFFDLPKVNTRNPEVRKYLFDVVRHWMSLGVDGWRLDVPNEVDPDFWREFRRVVKGIKPDAYIVGEIWQDGSFWLQGDQFDAVMNYLFRDALLEFFIRGKWTVEAFDRRIKELLSMYPKQVNQVQLNLLGSHDTERILTAAGGDIKRVRLATLFQMTYVGPPIIYYGDEVGLTGGRDPGSRRTFPWEPAEQDGELLEWYKRLIQIHHSHPALQTGAYKPILVDLLQETYAYLRSDDKGDCVAVLLNNSRDAGDVEIPFAAAVDCQGHGSVQQQAGEEWEDILSGRRFTVNGGKLLVPGLGPQQGMILVPTSSPPRAG